MTGVQRWARAYGHGGPQPQPDGMFPSESGKWVMYDEHLEALNAAEDTGYERGYAQGYNAHASGQALSYEMYGLPKGYDPKSAGNRP